MISVQQRCELEKEKKIWTDIYHVSEQMQSFLFYVLNADRESHKQSHIPWLTRFHRISIISTKLRKKWNWIFYRIEQMNNFANIYFERKWNISNVKEFRWFNSKQKRHCLTLLYNYYYTKCVDHSDFLLLLTKAAESRFLFEKRFLKTFVACAL